MFTILCDAWQEPTERSDPTEPICTFCRTNDPRAKVNTGHRVKDSDGRVTCPILRKYVCQLCGATGDTAHTIRYCPLRSNEDAPDVRKLKTTPRHASKSSPLLCCLSQYGPTVLLAPPDFWEGYFKRCRCLSVRLSVCRQRRSLSCIRHVSHDVVISARGRVGLLFRHIGATHLLFTSHTAIT